MGKPKMPKIILLEYSREEIVESWKYIYGYCKDDVSIIPEINIIDKVIKKATQD